MVAIAYSPGEVVACSAMPFALFKPFSEMDEISRVMARKSSLVRRASPISNRSTSADLIEELGGGRFVVDVTTYNEVNLLYRDRLSFVSEKIYAVADEAASQCGCVGEEKAKLTQAAREAAEILALMPLNLPVPEPSVTGDFELQLKWRRQGKEAVAVFDGEGVFGAAFLKKGLFVPAPADIRLAEGFPKVITEYLSD